MDRETQRDRDTERETDRHTERSIVWTTLLSQIHTVTLRTTEANKTDLISDK